MEITAEQYKELIKKNKFRNIRTKVNGISFQSKAEAEFYKFLFDYDVKHRRQVKYKLVVNNMLICYYYADFVVPLDDKEIVIDVKGMETRDFKIKRKLMKAVHGVDVVVLKKSELQSWALLLRERQKKSSL